MSPANFASIPGQPDARRFSRSARSLLACAAILATLCFVAGCGGASVESRLAEVQALQDAGQFNDSIDPLRDVLSEQPDHASANLLLAMALIKTQQHSLAIWPLEKAAKDPQLEVTANLMLAQTSNFLKGHEDAVRALNRVLELEPGRPDALRMRSESQLSAGNFNAALVDADALESLAPNDYSVLLLKAVILSELERIDESEAIYARLRELADATGDASLSAKACLAVATFLKDRRKDEERAVAAFRGCLDEFPSNNMVLRMSTSYLDAQGFSEEATAAWARAVAASPEAINLRLDYAIRLEKVAGDDEAAEQVLREGAENFGLIQTWAALANFVRARGRYDEAVEAIGKAVDAAGGGNDELRFLQADMLLDAEEIERAREVALTLTVPIYAELLEGRIKLLEGDPKGALVSLEAAIRNWPNNAGARYLAGIAARELGNDQLALSHLREAVRTDPGGTDAALITADIMLRRGDYEPSYSMLERYLNTRSSRNEDAYRTLVRAGVALERYKPTRTHLETFASKGGDPSFVAVQLAILARAQKGPDAAIAVVTEADLDLNDVDNEELLRSYTDNLAAASRDAEAVAAVDAAIASRGESASLLELRGTLLAMSGDEGGARASLEAALALEEDNARAIAALATLEARAGDVAKAIDRFDRAAELAPADPSYPYSAAQLTLALGQVDEAIRRYEAVVQAHPTSTGAHNDLAWLLANREQDLDRALALANRAASLEASAGILDTLGWVRFKRGETSQAIAAYEQALEASPEDPSILYHQALAFEAAGETDRAIEALEQALSGQQFAELADAQQQLAALKQR